MYHNDSPGNYRHGSDSYMALIREAKQVQRDEERKSMQDYITQRQYSSEISYSNISNSPPEHAQQKHSDPPPPRYQYHAPFHNSSYTQASADQSQAY